MTSAENLKWQFTSSVCFRFHRWSKSVPWSLSSPPSSPHPKISNVFYAQHGKFSLLPKRLHQVIKDWIGSRGCLWPCSVETSLIKYLPARPVTLYIHHMLHPQVCSIYWQWTIQNREYITELGHSSELNNGENGRNLTIQAFTVSAQYARIIKS